jgi:hypothetical protein
MKPRALLTLGLIAFMVGFGLASPFVGSIPAGGFAQVAAGKKWQAEAWQGWATWSNTLYFTAHSRAATGAILDFSNVKLGAGGYVMPRLGWCSDTSGVNMTLTGIAQYSVSYTVTGAGSTRVWCPDRGEPVSVTGSTAMIWDAVNQVATVTTGAASTVVLTWTHASTLVDYTNFYDAFILLSIVPVVIGAVVVIGSVSGAMTGGDAAAAAIVAVVFAIAGVLAVVVMNAIITA